MCAHGIGDRRLGDDCLDGLLLLRELVAVHSCAETQQRAASHAAEGGAQGIGDGAERCERQCDDQEGAHGGGCGETGGLCCRRTRLVPALSTGAGTPKVPPRCLAGQRFSANRGSLEGMPLEPNRREPNSREPNSRHFNSAGRGEAGGPNGKWRRARTTVVVRARFTLRIGWGVGIA